MRAEENEPIGIELFLRLSDARWSRLWTMIERYDEPATPYRTDDEARELLLAMLYRALTDVAWNALPGWAPPAAEVKATYRRWQRLGLLPRLATELLIQLDSDIPEGEPEA